MLRFLNKISIVMTLIFAVLIIVMITIGQRVSPEPDSVALYQTYGEKRNLRIVDLNYRISHTFWLGCDNFDHFTTQWDTEGTSILYACSQQPNAEKFLIDVLTGEQRVLEKSVVSDQNDDSALMIQLDEMHKPRSLSESTIWAVYSLDRQKIVIQSRERSDSLHLVNSTGGMAYDAISLDFINHESIWGIEWSPDARYIALVSEGGGQFGNSYHKTLYLIDLQSKVIRQIVKFSCSSEAWIIHLRWSSDSQRISFYEECLSSIYTFDLNGDLWRKIPFEGDYLTLSWRPAPN